MYILCLFVIAIVVIVFFACFTTISAKAVIPKLDNIFAMFGTPEIVKTDNGPLFNGSEFARFADYIGFKHKKVTALWPQANGEAERFMKTIEKSLRAAVIEGRSWKRTSQFHA